MALSLPLLHRQVAVAGVVMVAVAADEEAEEVNDVDISTCTITNYVVSIHLRCMHANLKIQHKPVTV